jgi:hypothetical protein
MVIKTPIRALLYLVAPAALLSVTACAPSGFKAQVNRFQSMPAPQGQSFAIVSSDAKYANSLEFSQYASLVSQKMAAQGYQVASSPEAANLVVTMGFAVDKGKERTRIDPFAYDPYMYDPFYRGYYGRYGRGYGAYGRGGFGYGRPGFMHGFYDPFLFSDGYGAVERYTVFTSDLDLKIDSKSDGKRVFEGKAQAMSLNNNLTYIVPNLVEAMFTGFPGNSGETVRITVAQPKRK